MATMVREFLPRPRGSVITRGNWDEDQVRLYGDAAIAIGTQTSRWTYKGQPAGGRFRVTHVALRRGDGWILAGLQLSGTPETSEQ
jgi:hypothetical protein